MTKTQKTMHTIKQQPILSSVFAVIFVLMLGVASGYALGFDAPAKAYAQLVPVAPVVVVAPPPVEVPVVVTVPTIPIITPVVTPSPTQVSGVTVTGSKGDDTVTGGTGTDVITTVSGVDVVGAKSGDQDTSDSPCCTQKTTDTPVSPVVVTAAVPSVDQDTSDSPCCTVPVTTNPTPVIPIVTTPVVITPPIVVTPPIVTPPIIVPPENPQPECIALTGTPHDINPGDAVTLAWQTKNATSITINNGVGSVTPVASGSTVVHPTTDTTYIATVANAVGSVHCQASVHITSTPVGTSGMCVQLTASATSINPGDAVTLSWVTSNASSVMIDNGIGNVTPVASGSTVVHPTTATTYSAAVPGESIKTACQVHVDITSTSTPPGGGCTSGCGGGGGGGGGHGGGGGSHPSVLLASSQPLASVYLSQIPYTGLDLGPIGTVLYWMILVLWSLAAAYLILFAGIPFALRRAQGFGSNIQTALNHEPVTTHVPEAPMAAEMREHSAHAAPMQSYAAYAAAVMPAIASVAPVAPVAPVAHLESVQQSVAMSPTQSTLACEGFKSFANGDALTIDDIVKGLSRESGMVFTQHVEAEPEAAYDTDMTPRASRTTASTSSEDVSAAVIAPVSSPVAAQSAPVALIAYSDDVPGFLSALISGDREKVFGALRDVNRTGGDSQEFLTHAVCALDDAYRARIDGTPCHPDIARITNTCATSFLERLVSSLATAIDSSYSAGITGAKLAVTRALSVVNG